MLEKIGMKYYHKISIPNEQVLSIIQELKKVKTKLCILEIGIGIGATSLEICKLLSKKDEFIFMDYQDKIDELLSDLNNMLREKPILVGIGNSHKKYDSYAWSILKLINQNKKVDLVFLDGAHNFITDGLVLALIEDILSVEGYLIVDEVNFRIQEIITHNPSKKREIMSLYTMEQIESQQLLIALQQFVLSQSKFEEITDEMSSTRVFRLR